MIARTSNFETSSRVARGGDLVILTITTTARRARLGPRVTRDHYRVEPNPNAPGAFRLHKLVHADEEPTIYDVGTRGWTRGCSCPGYLQHERCKHHSQVLAQCEAGNL